MYRVLTFTRTQQNVLPMVNKALALWKQDIGAAERYCQEALKIDPECDIAVATLAQLSLQQGKVGTAVDLFKRQVELVRTEPELANALAYMYASVARETFLDVGVLVRTTVRQSTNKESQNYPERKQAFSTMAQGMAP